MKRFIAKVSKSYKGGEKGFTLIELLIVIVILGVLAAAIIPNLSKFVGSGKVGAANAELAAVRTAVSAYMSTHDGAPEASDADPATYEIVPGEAWIHPYISSDIDGSYSVTSEGVIDGADHPDATWDGTKFIE